MTEEKTEDLLSVGDSIFTRCQGSFSSSQNLNKIHTIGAISYGSYHKVHIKE